MAADSVATRVIAQTKDYYIAHFTNISGGDGEAAVVKVDKSTLLASDGAEPASLDIERVVWCCEGMSVNILWDHTTDDLALALSGRGEINLSNLGISGLTCGQIKDPRSTGGTGDILFTTVGHTSADTYNITLYLRKNPD